MPRNLDTNAGATGTGMIASRHHDISCAHRIYGHPGKCGDLHGHNYRIHFHCSGLPYDTYCGYSTDPGIVIDFSIMKSTLCQWLDENWDHKLILWEKDPLKASIGTVLTSAGATWVPFNPTAENMAQFLLEKVGPTVLPKDVALQKVVVEETRKCSATASATKQCPICHGSGWWETKPQNDYVPEQIKCEECGGSGRVQPELNSEEK